MKELKVSAIQSGTVIDHIQSDYTLKVVDILDLRDMKEVVSVVWNLPSSDFGKKGMIKIGGKNLTEDEVNKIALIAPDATMNIIKNYEVVKKINLTPPEKIEKIIKCSNPKCITNKEGVKTVFYLVDTKPMTVRCHYCERCMMDDEIVLI